MLKHISSYETCYVLAFSIMKLLLQLHNGYSRVVMRFVITRALLLNACCVIGKTILKVDLYFAQIVSNLKISPILSMQIIKRFAVEKQHICVEQCIRRTQCFAYILINSDLFS